MENQIKLGRFFGVEIGLHMSWFIIAFLITLSVGQDFQAHNPHWTPATVWTTAALTGVLFFFTIIVHEMSHALVARARGIPVRAITLFALGGVAQIEREPDDAKTEFWVGVVGPLTSFAIGGACLLAARLLGVSGATPARPVLALLVWLGYINIGLALFNLIPGFPLDGGRVLKSLIWWGTGSGPRSTRLAARIGQWVAWGFIFFGILRFFQGAGFNGLWLAFIGWFLKEAAQTTVARADWSDALRGTRVRDLMSTDTPTVSSAADLETFVQEMLLTSGRRCFLVEEHGKVTGLVTLHEVKAVARPDWSRTPVRQVMRRLDQLHAVTPETSGEDALAMMIRENVNQLPVASGGAIEGLISRQNLLQLLRARSELKV